MFGRNNTVFHLQSPNLEQILARRISYVEENIDKDFRVAQWRKRQDWSEFRDAALMCAAKLKQDFLVNSTSGRQILALLASAAWHDVRYFFRLLGGVHSLLGNDDRPWKATEVICALIIHLCSKELLQRS